MRIRTMRRGTKGQKKRNEVKRTKIKRKRQNCRKITRIKDID